MKKIDDREVAIIEAIKILEKASFGDIFDSLSGKYAERTLKRDLSELVTNGYLETSGAGRSTEYHITPLGRLFLPIDADAYNAKDLDARTGVLDHYQFSVWKNWPATTFSSVELTAFGAATQSFQERSVTQTADIQRRELERFVIEMSWKSSKIEGNTYTLLDTELLLKEGIPSKTNSEEETTMILNHKRAFDFVLGHRDEFRSNLSLALIDTLHQHLTKDLLRDQGLRTGVVGITGSRYRPLDNQHQLRDALEELLAAVNHLTDPYSKALTTLLGISYIQPFTDGNKRTARLLTNGILLSNDMAPLSYRDVDERNYRASLLVFYEQLSLMPMKALFSAQYYFSTEHYSKIS